MLNNNNDKGKRDLQLQYRENISIPYTLYLNIAANLAGWMN